MAKKAASSAPKKKSLYTIKLEEDQMNRLEEVLKEQSMDPYEVDHSRFAFKGDRLNVVAYKSGKVVIQGKRTEEFVQFHLEAEVTGEARMGYEEVHNPQYYEAHAGLDESGKGDLFGPLVSACVIADGDMVRKWVEEGLQETKKISSDAAVYRLEKLIRGTEGVVVKTTWAGMRKYNYLYTKFGSNLNKLLAWMHAKSLEDALKRRRVPWGMLDQFSKQPLVQNFFKDSSFDLRMETKAERDPVVAAASICARAEFLRQLEKLSTECGEELAKGSGAKAKEQAIILVDKLGPGALVEFAKMHFKTAKEAIGNEAIEV